MKTIILLFLMALAIPAASQVVGECECAENSLNQSNGQRIVQSKFYIVGKNERNNIGLLVSVRRIDSLYYLYIVSQLPGCTGPATAVTFITTTGQTIKKNHIGDVSCAETWLVVWGIPSNTATIIKTLIDDEMIRKGTLSRIRLSSSENYVNINLSMPFNLRTVFDCVDGKFIKEAKSKPKKGLQNN